VRLTGGTVRETLQMVGLDTSRCIGCIKKDKKLGFSFNVNPAKRFELNILKSVKF
jgi:hypothetical protein